MTDRQTLLLVFGLVYFSECVLWMRRGGVLFRRGLGRWTASTASGLIQNDRGDLHWSWPLPPFGSLYVALGLPFSLGPLGILNSSAACFHPTGRPLTSPAFLQWNEIKTVEVNGCVLKLNNAVFWKADSIHSALRLGLLIRSLQKGDPSQLESTLLNTLETLFNEELIRKRLATAQSALSSLRFTATLLFCHLFAVTPVTLVFFDWFPSLYFLVPPLLLLSAYLSRSAVLAHRQLYPEAHDDRFRLGFMSLLSPAAAIRAIDHVQRPLLEDFSPVAVASVLLDKLSLETFARPAWRDLRFPRLPECSILTPAAQETELWFRLTMTALTRKSLKQGGLDSDSWELPAIPTDPSHTLFCPRCETQFTSKAKGCRECGDRPLLSLLSNPSRPQVGADSHPLPDPSSHQSEVTREGVPIKKPNKP